MEEAVSLQEQCQRYISLHLLEFSVKQISRVPYKLRRSFIVFDKFSLVDLWRLEKSGFMDGMDMENCWDQVVVDRGVPLSGLDFVHRYDGQPPRCKAFFNHSIGGRDTIFQRLWKDLENLANKYPGPDSVTAIQNFLFSIPSAPVQKREGQQQVLMLAQPHSVTTIKALKLIVDLGVRPSYLTHSPIMEYFKSDENAAAIMKHLTSQVIGVNTPCDKMGEEWFENVLTNSMPTLKLSVHYDLLCNISSHVLKCLERKKLDELIIRVNDKNVMIEELSSFTNGIMLRQSSHIRLLEITSLHQFHWGLPGEILTIISSASPLVWFLQQPTFSCLRLSGVISTAVGKSLILTFLSTPCTSLQCLELRNMVADTTADSSSVQSLPEGNDYYHQKCLLIDNISMAHAKQVRLNNYLLNKDAIEQYYATNPHAADQSAADSKSSVTSWLLNIKNLRVGTLQVYDYDTNCTHVCVPSTTCIEALKVFIVFKSDEICYTWTSPTFTSLLRLPTLCKCIWEVRAVGVPQKGNQYLRQLADILLDKKDVPSRNLRELFISIDKDLLVTPYHLTDFNRAISVLSELKVTLDACTYAEQKESRWQQSPSSLTEGIGERLL